MHQEDFNAINLGAMPMRDLFLHLLENLQPTRHYCRARREALSINLSDHVRLSAPVPRLAESVSYRMDALTLSYPEDQPALLPRQAGGLKFAITQCSRPSW